VKFPADAPEGTYPFQLRAIAVNDPDNDHAEGPMTIAKLGPIGGTKSRLWLWILLGLLAVAVIGGAAYYAFGREEVAPPSPAPPATLTTPQALRLSEKKTAAWWSAISKQDVDTLVSLSPPPFFFDQAVLLDESQIRSKYKEMFDQEAARKVANEAVPVGEVTAANGLVEEAPAANDHGLQEIRIDKILAYTIGDLKKDKPEYLANDRVMNAMKLGDDDIAVIVMYRGEGTIHFFRRSARDVEMAGFWN
jgi:hypothetical protein